MFPCALCKKDIPAKHLVVAKRFYGYKPYHNSCYADVIQKEGAYFDRQTIMNSVYGKIQYVGSYILMAVGVLILVMSGAYILLVGLRIEPIVMFCGSIALIGSSIYYIRTYRKYRPYFADTEMITVQGTKQDAKTISNIKSRGVICTQCHSSITSKSDLATAIHGSFWVRPYHKSCYIHKLRNNILTTGYLVNSAGFMVVTVIATAISAFTILLFMFTLSTDVNIPLLLTGLIAMLMPIMRWYSYTKLEKPLETV